VGVRVGDGLQVQHGCAALLQCGGYARIILIERGRADTACVMLLGIALLAQPCARLCNVAGGVGKEDAPRGGGSCVVTNVEFARIVLSRCGRASRFVAVVTIQPMAVSLQQCRVCSRRLEQTRAPGQAVAVMIQPVAVSLQQCKVRPRRLDQMRAPGQAVAAVTIQPVAVSPQK
jgi:hypothetical protein